MKAQIINQLPESSFEVIIAEENNTLVWKDNGKEFSLNGEMYDVAKIKIENGKTVIYCINDTKETRLLENFIKAMKNDASNSKSGKSNLKLQFAYYIINTLDINTAAASIYSSGEFTIFNSALYLISQETDAPPPRA